MILTAWLLHSIRLAAALGTALLLMQAPAVTREYQAALLQLVRSSGQEIAERKASAQRFYGIASGEDEEGFLAQLQAVEPSNAQTLAALVERERGLRQSYDRIEHASGLLRPSRPRMWPPIRAAPDGRSPILFSTASHSSSTCPSPLPSTARLACS